jgi:hypothetical protein
MGWEFYSQTKSGSPELQDLRSWCKVESLFGGYRPLLVIGCARGGLFLPISDHSSSRRRIRRLSRPSGSFTPPFPPLKRGASHIFFAHFSIVIVNPNPNLIARRNLRLRLGVGLRLGIGVAGPLKNVRCAPRRGEKEILLHFPPATSSIPGRLQQQFCDSYATQLCH